ncbi:hypothetical protein HRbin36_02898 [bacterium HR36]|nr:hypothetical protein HRbin36_02898 [bacterium HR36]
MGVVQGHSARLLRRVAGPDADLLLPVPHAHQGKQLLLIHRQTHFRWALQTQPGNAGPATSFDSIHARSRPAHSRSGGCAGYRP